MEKPGKQHIVMQPRYFVHMHAANGAFAWLYVEVVRQRFTGIGELKAHTNALFAEAFTKEELTRIIPTAQRCWPGCETLIVHCDSDRLIPNNLKKVFMK